MQSPAHAHAWCRRTTLRGRERRAQGPGGRGGGAGREGEGETNGQLTTRRSDDTVHSTPGGKSRARRHSTHSARPSRSSSMPARAACQCWLVASVWFALSLSRARSASLDRSLRPSLRRVSSTLQHRRSAQVRSTSIHMVSTLARRVSRYSKTKPAPRTLG